MKPRHRLILQALLNLGMKGTARDIARISELEVAGVVQSLKVLTRYVKPASLSRRGEKIWELVRTPPYFTPRQWEKLNGQRIRLAGLSVLTERQLQQFYTLDLYLQRHPQRQKFLHGLRPQITRVAKVNKRTLERDLATLHYAARKAGLHV